MNFENSASNPFSAGAFKLMSKAPILPDIFTGFWQKGPCLQQNFPNSRKAISLARACLPRPEACFALSRPTPSSELQRQQFAVPADKEFESKQNFLTDLKQAEPEVAVLRPAGDSQPGRDPLKVLIIGSRQGVIGTIHTLHLLGFAEVGEWSPLLPGPNPGEVLSILTRSLPME